MGGLLGDLVETKITKFSNGNTEIVFPYFFGINWCK